jgi:formylglycine-generating enzyme required for sulfatase activity/tRNA A-37 threonylcarbamoyl transferase component Bud32
MGKYEILEALGRGGFAAVYRARDTKMEREVALKVITGNFTDEASFIQRFRQEARIAANLRHPNIVPVYDFGEVDGALYIAMALIGEGRTLRDLLDEQAPLTLAEALPLLTPLANALDYLHQQDPPLVHRDIKPSNVLLEGTDGSHWVVLTDFGLVRSLQASTELTQSGSILGTPAYLAPEQADVKQWGEITPRTDVYALGVVAYEMLTGRAPFSGETPTVLHAHAYESPPPPQELLPDLGDELSAVLLHALRKTPAERYPSAGAFAAALQDVAETWNEAAQQEATLEQLEAQAQELLEAGEWLEALDCCTQMMRLDPARSATLKMFNAAKKGLDREQDEERKRRRLTEQYQTGLALLAEEKWKQALDAFKAVSKDNPDFRDVQENLVQAQDELQRAQWYDEAIAHSEAERWAEACRVWLRVLHDRVDYREGDAAVRLLAAAESLVSQHDTLTHGFKRSRQALRLYEALLLAFERQAWEEAVSAGEALLQLSADLKGVQAWVERARGEVPALQSRRELESAGDTGTQERDGKEMVRIPAGKFLYGRNQEERELPVFWIDKTPVTNTEYGRFVAASGHKPPRHWKGERPPEAIAEHPVTYVSWHDAVAYAEWAGKRLPTEEEWEKAARGTDGRTYPWGEEEPTPDLCNFGQNEGGTTPVGKYSPHGDSPDGCVDMAGNVWEWTVTDYDDESKVLRGGSWVDNPLGVRCAGRVRYDPYVAWDYDGFRCARGSQ